MPIRDSKPIIWVATGLSDSPHEFMAFPGCCTQLSNFIFDRINRNGLSCRAGVGSAITSFSGFTTPGVVSVMIAVGSRLYGMVDSGATSGYEEPFCYDTATSAFVSISGVTSGNVPSTASTTGTWTPPTMAVISTKIIVTHPGFSGAGSNFFGVIDISTPASPAWSSANTTTNTLPNVPLAVSQFYNRAWFACSNVIYYSDSLVPTTITNSSQSLTLGDTSPVTAMAGLPVSTATQGILQALICFKGAGKGVWQVTGDSALSNLVLNELSGSNGTDAPRSVVSVPNGLAYMDSDGLRLVNLLGQVVFLSTEVVDPFINATTPSRASATYANSVYRICLDTVIQGNTVTGADLWYDMLYNHWDGPHSFPYDCAVRIGNSCYLVQTATPAKIWAHDVVPTTASTYSDNGSAYVSRMIGANLNMPATMDVKSVIESTVEIVGGIGAQYTVNAQIIDESGNTAGSATVNSLPVGSAWNAVTWGNFQWSSVQKAGVPTPIPWESPVVFSIPKITASIDSQVGVNIKEWLLRVQYLNRTNTRAS